VFVQPVAQVLHHALPDDGGQVGLRDGDRRRDERDRNHDADEDVEQMQVAVTTRREQRAIEHDLRQQGRRDTQPGGDEDHRQYGGDLPPVRPKQSRDPRNQVSSLH